MNKLQRKQSLRARGENTAIAVEKLRVILQWQAPVDLDLMAFYRAKDGRVGGVFSDNYPGGNLGSLNTFPHIRLAGDDGLAATSEEHSEELVIERLDEMSEVYICTLNYTDASEEKDSTFSDYDGKVIVSDDNGHTVEVNLNSDQPGQVAVIAYIEHTQHGTAILKNESLILSIEEFFQRVPGASLISSNNEAVQDNTTETDNTPKTTQQALDRWTEIIRLQTLDNPIIDKQAEKSLLGEAIGLGVDFDEARQHLIQVCTTEHYALMSYLEQQVLNKLLGATEPQHGINHATFMETVVLLQKESYGHIDRKSCLKLVKATILSNKLPVKEGFFKGGNWFTEI